MSDPVMTVRAFAGAVSVEVAQGHPPFTVSLAGMSQSKPSRTFGFMNVRPGDYVVSAVDGSGRCSEVEVVVP